MRLAALAAIIRDRKLAPQTTHPDLIGLHARRPHPLGHSFRSPLRQLLILAALVLLAGLAYTVWWALVARYHEHTDNAYVSGNLVQITPQTSGAVLSILADDTDYVTAGQPLVLLDPADARVALEQAEADLAQQVRLARNLFASRAAAAAQLALRQAELTRAEADLARRQQAAGGAVAQEELAQLLGASRQRVNQELKAMEREDAIRIEPGGLVVRDRQALMRIAEADA